MKLISFDQREESVLKNLYTNKSSEWIDTLTNEEIVPHVLQLWLLANVKVRIQARWLDKYTYTLPPKMYLSLAWSVIPKVNRMPFMNYIKKNKKDDRYDFILDSLRKQFELSDNDFNIIKGRLIDSIENNKEDWFRYYGVPKKYWRQNKIDFNKIREGRVVEPKKSGLEVFGK